MLAGYQGKHGKSHYGLYNRHKRCFIQGKRIYLIQDNCLVKIQNRAPNFQRLLSLGKLNKLHRLYWNKLTNKDINLWNSRLLKYIGVRFSIYHKLHHITRKVYY